MEETPALHHKTVGIIGGMGPAATVDLMARVIRATPARDDADHLRMLVDNNPRVPSRIAAIIEGSGPSPAPVLVQMARNLEAWGADFLAMPCNTAHYYYEEIQGAVDVPVLDMIELTTRAVATRQPGIERVGLLASTAVLLTGLFHDRFARRDVEVLQPGREDQERLMEAIRAVKSGRAGQREREALQQAAGRLADRGVRALLVACTELSLLAGELEIDLPLYDSAQVLAEAIVATARGEQGLLD